MKIADYTPSELTEFIRQRVRESVREELDGKALSEPECRAQLEGLPAVLRALADGYDRESAREPLRPQSIYFMRAGKSGPFKIGIATDPVGRLYKLQIGNHQALTLEASLFGDYECERALHQHFRKSRIRGEWFGATPALLGLVDAIARTNESSEGRVPEARALALVQMLRGAQA